MTVPGALCWAGACPVCLHGESSCHSLSPWCRGANSRAPPSRTSEERKGWHIGKVLCHQAGLGRVIWFWFMLAVLSLESGSGVPKPEVATLSGRPCPPGELWPFYSGHFQKIAALSSSLCLGLVLTATATYIMTWQHCSVSTHVVTDVCQVGRNLRAPCCCFLTLAAVQGPFLGPALRMFPQLPQERRARTGKLWGLAPDSPVPGGWRSWGGQKLSQQGPSLWNSLT